MDLEMEKECCCKSSFKIKIKLLGCQNIRFSVLLILVSYKFKPFKQIKEICILYVKVPVKIKKEWHMKFEKPLKSSIQNMMVQNSGQSGRPSLENSQSAVKWSATLALEKKFVGKDKVCERSLDLDLTYKMETLA